MLHRRATDRRRCHCLRPRDLDLTGHGRYLCALGRLKCRVNTKFVMNTPKRALRCLTRSLIFLGSLGPRVIKVKPFIPRRSAGFTRRPTKDISLALFLLSIVQVLLPRMLLPTAATLKALSPENERGNFRTNTGMMVPGLSPIGGHGRCRLCSGGVYANRRTTRYEKYLTEHIRSMNCRVIASHKSSPVAS